MQIGKESVMEWKYKIDVKDENVFEEIEKQEGIVFPDELKSLILKCNAATPSKYNFMLDREEKVFGAVLSFNQGESDTDTVFTALKTIKNKALMPFAIDPFGNYICYDLSDHEIVFWNHETDDITSTGKHLQDFLDSLY